MIELKDLVITDYDDQLVIEFTAVRNGVSVMTHENIKLTDKGYVLDKSNLYHTEKVFKLMGIHDTPTFDFEEIHHLLECILLRVPFEGNLPNYSTTQPTLN